MEGIWLWFSILETYYEYEELPTEYLEGVAPHRSYVLAFLWVKLRVEHALCRN